MSSPPHSTLPSLVAGTPGAPASPITSRLLESHEWAGTALGEPAAWPPSLRLAVSICLNSRFPMFVWWGESLVNIYNDAYIPVLGQRHPRAFGAPAGETWHEIWDVVGPQQRAVMERGEATWNERVLLVMERNGFTEETWFTWSYSPVYREDGRIGGLFCACTEETARVLAERERDQLIQDAQTTAATLQGWFDNAPGFVALLRGTDHVFELVNQAYYELVGHRELIGRRLEDALPEVMAQGFGEMLDEVRRSGQPFIGRSVRALLHKRPGAPLEERFLDLVYQPVRDSTGAVAGIFAQGHDVTDQVNATAALREADRRKDEFIAILAHELRNPLAPIRQGAYLARIAPPEDVGRRTRALEIIERQVGQMTVLIDDLLDVSRISQGKLQLRPERIALARIIDLALESALPAVSAKKHALEVVLPEAELLLEVDPVRMAQALANLLTNAAKYTDAGGTIRIEAAFEGEQVRIGVRDNGIGVSEDDRGRLFSMFSQLQTALERSEGGLGIGLALTRGLVELHGGTISVQSAGRGQGSEFVILLPRLATRAHEPAARPPASTPTPVLAPRGPSAPPRRLLIADDNADARESLSLLLQAQGHQVVTAADGEEALALALERRPDIAILDIGMPGLNGYEVARRLREQPGLEGLVLVALTGWGHEEDRAKALAHGFDRHCTKPVPFADLMAVLALQRG